MANQNDVVARGIRLAVHGVTDVDRAQAAAALQAKTLCLGKAVLPLDEMQSSRAHFELFPPATDRSASCACDNPVAVLSA